MADRRRGKTLTRAISAQALRAKRAILMPPSPHAAAPPGMKRDVLGGDITPSWAADFFTAAARRCYYARHYASLHYAAALLLTSACFRFLMAPTQYQYRRPLRLRYSAAALMIYLMQDGGGCFGRCWRDAIFHAYAVSCRRSPPVVEFRCRRPIRRAMGTPSIPHATPPPLTRRCCRLIITPMRFMRYYAATQTTTRK